MTEPNPPITMWRCPVCQIVLLGRQIANAELHLSGHADWMWSADD